MFGKRKRNSSQGVSKRQKTAETVDVSGIKRGGVKEEGALKRVKESVFEVKQSSIEGAGKGLYVNEGIGIGVMLGWYTGPVRKEAMDGGSLYQFDVHTSKGSKIIDPKPKDYEDYKEAKDRDRFNQGTSGLNRKEPSLMGFINTHTDPSKWNIRFEEVEDTASKEGRSIIAVTSRAIQKGEELLGSYGVSYDKQLLTGLVEQGEACPVKTVLSINLSIKQEGRKYA